MKRTLLLFVLGASFFTSALAQSSDATNLPGGLPPESGVPSSGMPPASEQQPVLTDEERQEVHKVHDDALASDPGLAAEDKALKMQVQAARAAGTMPSADLMNRLQEHHEKIRAAMIKVDPSVAPLLDKLDLAHHQGAGSVPSASPAPPAPSSP